MIIYVDVLFAVNLIITYFLLLASALLTGYTYNRKRIIISAITGACFCFYIFVQNEILIIDFAVKLASLLICSIAAFGISNKKKFVVQMLCFVLLNALLTGVVAMLSLKSETVYHKNMFYYFNINPVMLVVFSLVIYLIVLAFSYIKEEITPNNTYCLNIVFEDFEIEKLSAFYDSGCKVKDWVSNKDIMLVSFAKTEDKIPQKLKSDLINFFKEDFKNIRTAFTPVFFSTVSGQEMVPAIKPKYLKYKEKTIENVLIAFVKSEFGENVEAVFGTGIKKQL